MSRREVLQRLRPLAVILAAALLAFSAGSAQGAATLPSGFQQEQVVDGLVNPIDMEFAPDGRLFLAEQGGVLRVLKADGTLGTFLDISAKVDSTGERGLLGVTFDPDFSTNHFVYFHYTQKATRATRTHNRVVRVTASGDSAVAGSEKLIFQLGALKTRLYHNGGAIDFGDDGKLYISTGDNLQRHKAQQLSNLFGKVLRIEKNGAIPTDNPFYAQTSGRNRAIWALGLRNPFKFAVRPGVDTIFINDVGQDAWEEIDEGHRGANYGWPVYEGPETDPKYTPPIFEYGHDGDTNTTGCAITGGAFYDPATVQFPSGYVGNYFFADLCNGWIRSYDPATDKATGFATGLDRPVDLEVSKDGSLYYLSRGGAVSEIRYEDGTGGGTG